MSSGSATNVALKKTASADSEETSKGNTADKGNDDNISTRWCANDGNTNHKWKVDLGSAHDIIGTEVMWEFDGREYDYSIQVSVDNTNWNTVVNKNNNENTNQIQQDIFTAESIRYVRIVVTRLPSDTWASFWEFKVFGSPSITETEEAVEIPTEFKAYQNYPNPFNPTTLIKYQLPVESHVVLKVYDIIGREIETLVNRIQNAGYYSITFNANGLPSGVYIYSIRADNFSDIRKMILLK